MSADLPAGPTGRMTWACVVTRIEPRSEVEPETVVREAIAAERRELAGVLAGLTPEQWDAPSLCEGWRVREVAAHIVMAFRYSTWPGAQRHDQGARQLQPDGRPCGPIRCRKPLAGGAHRRAQERMSITRGSRRAAATKARSATTSSTAWTSPSPSVSTVPFPADRLRFVLDGVNPRQVKYFGVDLQGIKLQADDLDWSYGTGTPFDRVRRRTCCSCSAAGSSRPATCTVSRAHASPADRECPL